VEEYMEKREGAPEKQKMVCLNFDDGCLDKVMSEYSLRDSIKSSVNITEDNEETIDTEELPET
jgi:hypothetical protein